MGALGSSVCASLLIKDVQGRPLLAGTSPNPVSAQEAECFIALLTTKLDPVPDWLRNKETVAASAGANSIFRICCLVLSAMRSSGGAEAIPVEVTCFTYEQACAALEVCIGCSDEQLQKYASYPNADGQHLIVPKLCLLVAVMKHTGIRAVETVRCIGSCKGLMGDSRFWSDVAFNGDGGLTTC